MTSNEIKISPLLILITAASLIAVLWLFFMGLINPGLKEVGRSKIVEAVLQESFANGLLLTARLEQNINDSYEVLEQHEEFDDFSKTTHKVVVRGKKLHDPETSCTTLVRRAALFYFMQQIHSRFAFSPNSQKQWDFYVSEMKAVGVITPGQADMQVVFKDCARAKRLYDGLQSFFAVSKGYNYNFNY